MKHLPRTLEPTVKQVSSQFPVLLLTGPRQVGKSTLLADCAEPGRASVTLDDIEQRALAEADPALFLQMHPPPVIIDEVQYAPQLFSVIKIIVDEEKRPGMFWLTGSQKFHLMQGVSETLAGRVAILDLLGLSQAEINHHAHLTQPFLPTDSWLATVKKGKKLPLSCMEMYRRIWCGAFPRMVLGDLSLRDVFFRSYVQTYIERDVRALAKVGDEMAFARFLRVVAARTAQLVNYADMARDVDVDQKTIKSWLSILETSGLIYLLQPWHGSVTKRMVKTPKLYFLDTGLCAWLTQWSTPETLESGAMSGAIFETWVFAEILKSWWHAGRTPSFYFYRDRDQKEIDLLIEQDGLLYPVEFKKSASPSMNAANHFVILEQLKQSVGPGAVICLKEMAVPLSRQVMAVPAAYL
ncbi:MAG: ATP-binding protein [Gammaproteobacteria bacterium]|nr:ATP-binding protein [Gammaproteobacteria bacterium]